MADTRGKKGYYNYFFQTVILFRKINQYAKRSQNTLVLSTARFSLKNRVLADPLCRNPSGAYLRENQPLQRSFRDGTISPSIKSVRGQMLGEDGIPDIRGRTKVPL